MRHLNRERAITIRRNGSNRGVVQSRAGTVRRNEKVRKIVGARTRNDLEKQYKGVFTEQGPKSKAKKARYKV